MLKLSAKSGRMGRWHDQPLASVWLWTPLIPLSRGNWHIRDTAQLWKSPCIVAKLPAWDIEGSSFCTTGTVMPFTTAAVRIEGACLKECIMAPDKYIHTEGCALIQLEIGRCTKAFGQSLWLQQMFSFGWMPASSTLGWDSSRISLGVLHSDSQRRNIWGKENYWFTIQIQEIFRN